MKCSVACGARKWFILWTIGVYMATTIYVPLGPTQARAMTLSEEKELGRKVLDEIRKRYTLIEDGEIIDYVQSIGNRIANQLGKDTTYEYRFFLIDQSIPNAFAIPGGYIFMFRGLIEMMENEGELASILSHELGHVQAHHFEQRMQKGRVLSIASIAAVLAAVLLGAGGGSGSGAQALATGAIAGAQSLQLQYSREDEVQADQLGLRYMCAAGYDPKDMVSMMQKMAHLQWMTSSSVPSYLSTHPGSTERVQYLQTLVRNHGTCTPRKGVQSGPSGDFMLMQAALISTYSEPQAAMDRFLAWQKQKDHAAAASYGLGRLYMRRGDMDKAISQLQDAVRQRPDSAMILSTLGSAYFQQGRIQDAQRTFESALLIDPGASVAHYRLGLVLEEQGKPEAAIVHLRKAEPLAPILPEVNYQLGVALGQVNQLGLAHFYLARFYQHQRDWKTAIFHYEKAKPLLITDMVKSEEIKDALEEAGKMKKEAAKMGSDKKKAMPWR